MPSMEECKDSFTLYRQTLMLYCIKIWQNRNGVNLKTKSLCIHALRNLLSLADTDEHCTPNHTRLGNLIDRLMQLGSHVFLTFAKLVVTK